MVPISKRLFVGLGHPKYTGARSKYKSRYVFWIWIWLWLVLEHFDTYTRHWLVVAGPSIRDLLISPTYLPLSWSLPTWPVRRLAALTLRPTLAFMPQACFSVICNQLHQLWHISFIRSFSVLCNPCPCAYFEHPHQFGHLRLFWCIIFYINALKHGAKPFQVVSVFSFVNDN